MTVIWCKYASPLCLVMIDQTCIKFCHPLLILVLSLLLKLLLDTKSAKSVNCDLGNNFHELLAICINYAGTLYAFLNHVM